MIAIEKGARAPKPRELVELAALHGRPVSTLVRPGVESQPIAPHLRATLGDALDAALAAVIADLQAFADDYRNLERINGCEPFRDFPPEVSLPSGENAWRPAGSGSASWPTRPACPSVPASASPKPSA